MKIIEKLLVVLLVVLMLGGMVFGFIAAKRNVGESGAREPEPTAEAESPADDDLQTPEPADEEPQPEAEPSEEPAATEEPEQEPEQLPDMPEGAVLASALPEPLVTAEDVVISSSPFEGVEATVSLPTEYPIYEHFAQESTNYVSMDHVLPYGSGGTVIAFASLKGDQWANPKEWVSAYSVNFRKELEDNAFSDIQLTDIAKEEMNGFEVNWSRLSGSVINETGVEVEIIYYVAAAEADGYMLTVLIQYGQATSNERCIDDNIVSTVFGHITVDG